MLDIYKIVVAAFLMTDKANWIRFFKKVFLVANISPKVVFGMLFLILSRVDIDFLDRKFCWGTYITKEAFPTIRHVELVGKKEFAAIVLDPEYETFIIYITSLHPAISFSFTLLNIVYSFYRPQIAGLITKETFTKVFNKYIDFADIFSLDLASELLKYIKINNYAIKLVDGQQPPYKPIYNLETVKLETLNIYIETNLANKFIRLSKSSAYAPILFNRKSDSFFQLYANYKGLNNLTIKNRYPLLLVGDLLDRLRKARRFTQLKFTNAYNQMIICKENK